jgi:ABC-type Na+ efflux pump permease subunit
MDTNRESPRESLVVPLLVGIPAMGLALMFTLLMATYMGPQDNFVIFNGHQIGGTFDRILAGALAVVCGAIGIFALLIFHRRLVSRFPDDEAAQRGRR